MQIKCLPQLINRSVHSVNEGSLERHTAEVAVM